MNDIVHISQPERLQPSISREGTSTSVEVISTTRASERPWSLPMTLAAIATIVLISGLLLVAFVGKSHASQRISPVNPSELFTKEQHPSTRRGNKDESQREISVERRTGYTPQMSNTQPMNDQQQTQNQTERTINQTTPLHTGLRFVSLPDQASQPAPITISRSSR